MSRWVLRIEQPSPSLNRYTYARTPMIQVRDKKTWHQLIRGAAGFLEVPRAHVRRRLFIERHGRQALDKDNLLGGAKCVITDNLRKHGLIVNDTDQWVDLDGGNVRLQKGEKRPYTLLILEEVS